MYSRKIIRDCGMPRLTVEDLKRIKKETLAAAALKEGGYRVKITVHMGTCGMASGARKVMAALVDEISKRELKDILVTTSGCAGLCSREPMATVELLGEEPVKYIDLDEEKTRQIVTEHVLGGKIVEKSAIAIGSEPTF
jgi:NADP-reducing hydrogenase subunit HndB